MKCIAQFCHRARGLRIEGDAIQFSRFRELVTTTRSHNQLTYAILMLSYAQGLQCNYYGHCMTRSYWLSFSQTHVLPNTTNLQHSRHKGSAQDKKGGEETEKKGQDKHSLRAISNDVVLSTQTIVVPP